MTSLYALSIEYQSILDQLLHADMDAQTIADTIESTGLFDDIKEKACGIEMVARSLELSSPVIDVEIARLQALKKRREHGAIELREYLKNHMIACGISKIEAPLFCITLQNNPPAVEIYEPGLIAAEYMAAPKEPPPPAPDKAAIKRALQAGVEVQGARLMQGQRLVIK